MFTLKPRSNEICAKSKIVVVANHKGGCGKTAVCDALANYLYAEGGNSVLMIDADPQANLSQRFGILDIDEYANRSITQFYIDIPRAFNNSMLEYPVCIMNNNERNDKAKAIGLLAGERDTEAYARASEIKVGSSDLITRFKERIEVYKRYFDYIIIDTSPAIESTISNEAILKSADVIIVPFDGSEAILGMQIILDWVHKQFKTSPSRPEVLFVMTKYQKDAPTFRRIMDMKIQQSGNILHSSNKDECKNIMYKIMKTLFGESVCTYGIKELPVLRNNVYLGLMPNHTAHKKMYDGMCCELIHKINNHVGKDVINKWGSTGLRKNLMWYMNIVDESRKPNVNFEYVNFSLRVA